MSDTNSKIFPWSETGNHHVDAIKEQMFNEYFEEEFDRYLKDVCAPDGEFDFDGADNLEDIQKKYNDLKEKIKILKKKTE